MEEVYRLFDQLTSPAELWVFADQFHRLSLGGGETVHSMLLDWLRDRLTADAVRQYFAPLQPSRVVRYEAANLLALNFLLNDVLGGGASRSLRSDTQGKTLALALLQMPIATPPNHEAMRRPGGQA